MFVFNKLTLSFSHMLIIFLIAGVSGYIAANYYRKMGGDNWVWNINLTSALFACKFVSLLLVILYIHASYVKNNRDEQDLNLSESFKF